MPKILAACSEWSQPEVPPLYLCATRYVPRPGACSMSPFHRSRDSEHSPPSIHLSLPFSLHPVFLVPLAHPPSQTTTLSRTWVSTSFAKVRPFSCCHRSLLGSQGFFFFGSSYCFLVVEPVSNGTTFSQSSCGAFFGVPLTAKPRSHLRLACPPIATPFSRFSYDVAFSPCPNLRQNAISSQTSAPPNSNLD